MITKPTILPREEGLYLFKYKPDGKQMIIRVFLDNGNYYNKIVNIHPKDDLSFHPWCQMDPKNTFIGFYEKI